MTDTLDTTYSVALTVDIDGTDDDLARNLDAIDQATAVLKEARAELEQTLYDRHGRHNYDVDGLGRVEITRAANRKEFDKDQLISKVLATKIIDTRTGELETDLDAYRAAFATPNPRVTVLRARGIDPDEYCSTSLGPPRVRIVTP